MITASIVAYHTPAKELTQLIACVDRSQVETLYLIDNSSNDSLRELQAVSPKIRYIYSDNLGFGHGHNIAIRCAIEAGADYHVVLNPDIYWEEEVLGGLARFMDDNLDSGLVMPRVLYPDGRLQCLCKLLPTPADLFGRRFLPGKLRHRGDARFELHASGYDKVMEVPSLSGCFMFMRVEVLRRVGIFDERFFMYAEDLDLCRRIGEVSRTMYYPGETIFHAYGHGSYKNLRLLRYHIVSVIKYFNKWGWLFDGKRRQKNMECLQAIHTGHQKNKT